jgi:hypothetical protein
MSQSRGKQRATFIQMTSLTDTVASFQPHLNVVRAHNPSPTVPRTRSGQPAAEAIQANACCLEPKPVGSTLVARVVSPSVR